MTDAAERPEDPAAVPRGGQRAADPGDRARRAGRAQPPEQAVGERPPLRRRRSGRVVAGVAGGVADHLGVPVLWVRVVFAVLAGLSGAGVVGYGLLWAFVPQEPVSAERTASTRERQQAVGLLALAVGLAVLAGILGNPTTGWVTGPLGIALVGAVLVWREADEAQRRRWLGSARSGALGVLLGGGGTAAVIRVVGGASLVVTGIAVFLFEQVDLATVQAALLAVLATLAGVAVLTVPWWLRLVRDLNEERRVRIRTEERAEIAAHLHDSVLQTLALIQRQAEAPREVRRLARGQERQLRSWLYGPSGYGRRGATEGAEDGASVSTAPGVSGHTLGEAVAAACGEVEDAFAVNVQQVVVGDCELDERTVAAVHAMREAVVNAAKHAGVGEVSVYAEVEPDIVTVFVRDRGKGFDPEDVPADRHGLADSIRGRMERHGGTVRLRTAPGDGTEVQLTMPRHGGRRNGKEARG
ncbi:ATP-binding protein [Longimycelium tulufanense]|uniref:ATP-binding protein n=1 Tax=Longimycelium tulufanense TaxID=907463 RepID=UPI00166F6322